MFLLIIWWLEYIRGINFLVRGLIWRPFFLFWTAHNGLKMAAIWEKIKIFKKAIIDCQILIKSRSGANFSPIGPPQLEKKCTACRKWPLSGSPYIAQNRRETRFSNKNCPKQKNWYPNYKLFNYKLLVGTSTILRNQS